MSCISVRSSRSVSLINTLNEWIGKAVAWLTLAMVLTSFSIVVMRYAFDLGWIALQESVTYMHTLVFMLGAAYTLKHNEHVRVDIFYQRFSVRGKAWVDCLGSLFLLLPVSVFIGWGSWEYVADSWEVFEGSRHSGGLPGLFLLKSCILLMSALLILQGVSMFIGNLMTALYGKASSDD